jgi:hypothetical protein
MKKLLVIFLLGALLFPLALRADEGTDSPLLEDEALWNDIEAFREEALKNAGEKRPEPVETSPESLWLKDRTIEVGFANVEAGFPSGLLKEVFVIDLAEMHKGFFVNLTLAPFRFKYANENWGFSVFTGAEAFGDVAVSEKLVNFAMAAEDKSELVGAAFAGAGVGGFYRLGKFKLKAGFAGFVPLFYAYPVKLNYSRDKYITLDYDLRVYSAITDKGFKMGNKLGLDFGLGAEYPLASFLDLGLDVTNIPLKKGALTDYKKFEGKIKIGDPDEDEFFVPDNTESENWEQGRAKEIARPFKTLVWADWRPFNTPLFSVIGQAGFQINQLYAETFSMEGGLKARLNWANIIIVTAGARYEDRLWKNGVDLALNGRAFELDAGFDLRSHDFAESWKGSFFGLSFGIKVGW